MDCWRDFEPPLRSLVRKLLDIAGPAGGFPVQLRLLPLRFPPARPLSVPDTSTVTTYLFTDIEGSTGLWEREPERMAARSPVTMRWHAAA